MGITYKHEVSPLLTSGLAFQGGQGEFKKWAAEHQLRQQQMAQNAQLSAAQMQQRAALQTQAEQARLANQAQINQSYQQQAAMNNRARLMQEQMRQNQGAWGRADEGRFALEEMLSGQNPNRLIESGAGMHHSIMEELNRLDDAREQGSLRPQDYETAVTRLRGRAQRLQSPRYQKPEEISVQEQFEQAKVDLGDGRFVLPKGKFDVIQPPKDGGTNTSFQNMPKEQRDAALVEIMPEGFDPRTSMLPSADGTRMLRVRINGINDAGTADWEYVEEPQSAEQKSAEEQQKLAADLKEKRFEFIYDEKNIQAEAERLWEGSRHKQIAEEQIARYEGVEERLAEHNRQYETNFKIEDVPGMEGVSLPDLKTVKAEYLEKFREKAIENLGQRFDSEYGQQMAAAAEQPQQQAQQQAQRQMDPQQMPGAAYGGQFSHVDQSMRQVAPSWETQSGSVAINEQPQPQVQAPPAAERIRVGEGGFDQLRQSGQLQNKIVRNNGNYVMQDREVFVPIPEEIVNMNQRGEISAAQLKMYVTVKAQEMRTANDIEKEVNKMLMKSGDFKQWQRDGNTGFERYKQQVNEAYLEKLREKAMAIVKKRQGQ